MGQHCKKLACIKRGPYKVIKVHPSGSYDLMPTGVSNNSKVITKKHGSDLYRCPREIMPFPPLDTSDHAYSSINMPTISQPYEKAHVDGYTPATPWTAPSALIQLSTYIAPIFPTVHTLDT